MAQAEAETNGRFLVSEAVRQQVILDIPAHGSLTPLAEIARQLVGCEAAIIAIEDGDRLLQPTAVRFISVSSDGAFSISAASKAVDPLNAQELGFAFYAGLPLRTAEGDIIGTLALIDSKPRTVSEEQIRMLKLFASEVVALVASHLRSKATTIR